MSIRHYQFYELQSQGSDDKWRRFRQFENSTEAQAIKDSNAIIKQERQYRKNLSSFIEQSAPKGWRLVFVVKDSKDVCYLS
jgi:hypothetical protein